MASLSAAMNFEHGDGDEEYLLNGNESFATNHRHLPRASKAICFSAGEQQRYRPPMMGEAVGLPMKTRSMIGVTSLSLMVTGVDQP